ncbi:MAG: glycosyltransferase family 4 protein [Balneolales bacterium]
MRILFITFYFAPDLCAGSFRNTALVEALKEATEPDDTIDVVTTLPHRYHSYMPEAKEFEVNGKVHIHRIKIPEHRSGFLDQILSFKTFYTKVLKFVKEENYDIVFASSSKLFTAFLGARIARKKNTLLYLDIRDIFTDTINDVLNKSALKIVTKPILGQIEHYTITTADSLNLVSLGFKPYFQSFYNGNTSFYTNGIDEEFLNIEYQNNTPSGKPKIITYAGNIGEGQGLDEIIPEAAKKLEGSYHFKIIGDGGTKNKLEARIKELGVSNVEILKPISRKELPDIYAQSDFLFLHLNDYKAFRKVLPSKIFEYGATPLPIIAGVDGYARTFIQDNLDNAIVFDPKNAEEFVRKLKKFKPQYGLRHNFIEKYLRSNIMQEMAKSIIQTKKEEAVTRSFSTSKIKPSKIW